MTGKFGRRAVLAGGGLGLLAAAGRSAPAEAAAMSETETSNVKLVTAFVKSWEAKDYDPGKVMAEYLAPGASVRMEEDKPPIIGPDAVAAASKQFMTDGARIEVKIRQSFAKGPVVVNSRVDTVKTPGKPDQVFKVVGFFVVKKGKIQEWTDFLDA